MDVQKVVCLSDDDLVELVNLFFIMDWSLAFAFFISCTILFAVGISMGIRIGYKRMYRTFEYNHQELEL